MIFLQGLGRVPDTPGEYHGLSLLFVDKTARHITVEVRFLDQFVALRVFLSGFIVNF